MTGNQYILLELSKLNEKSNNPLEWARKLNKYFFKKEKHMASKHIK